MKLKLDQVLMILLSFILCIIATILIITYSKYKKVSNQILTNTKETENIIQEEETVPVDTGLSAKDFLNNITVGYNVGNSLDSCPSTGRNDGSHDTAYYETCWGNPVISKEYVDGIKNSGFNAIRLPVTWYYNTYVENKKLVIREEWLARVKEVIDYAIENDMYVILDSHHDAEIIWADLDDYATVSQNVSDLWSQIAEYFADYDEHLVFEAFNEINTKDNSWQYNQSAVQATNMLNQLFVDTIRSCSGNNSTRILICDTYLNETAANILEGFKLPKDSVSNKLALSVHSYDASYNQDIKSVLVNLQKYSKALNTPIVITEFGSTNTFVPIEYRSNHASNFIARAEEYGIKCFWWDDGAKFQLIDREMGITLKEDIVYAMMNPRKFVTQKTSTNIFNIMDSFEYGIVSSESGEIVDFEKGALTLNHGGQGYPVLPNYGYNIKLHTSGAGGGMKLCCIVFYNSHMNMIDYTEIPSSDVYDITPPYGAAYMRVSLYNPWGYRSMADYMNFLQSNSLSLEITEYIKNKD